MVRLSLMESSCNISVHPHGQDTWSHNVQQSGARPGLQYPLTRTCRITCFNHGVARWTSFGHHVDSSVHPTFGRLSGRLSCHLADHPAGRLFFASGVPSRLDLPVLSELADAAVS